MIRLTAQAMTKIQRIVAKDKCEKRYLGGRSRSGLGSGAQVQQQFRARWITFRLCISEKNESKVTFRKYRILSKFLRTRMFTQLDFAWISYQNEFQPIGREMGFSNSMDCNLGSVLARSNLYSEISTCWHLWMEIYYLYYKTILIKFQ